jgi:hypothetical protein
MARFRAVMFALVLLPLACGGNGSSMADGAAGAGGTGQGGGGVGGTGGAGGGDPACATAVAQQTCPTPNLSCGGESCTDVCSFCNVLICTSGRWQTMESFPAPCFACGPSSRCQNNVQYCQAFLPGLPTGTPTYSCLPVPSTCPPTPTCACLQTGGVVPGACQMTGAGQLTVTLAAP